jgi:hemerythrin-like domain-containing protein
MTTPQPDANPSGDEPLTNFSQCHAGILTHLGKLSSLPALLEPAAQARRIAQETADFFRKVIYEHHQEEERELFPAVLASAQRGAERERVQVLVDQLTAEHRQVEAMWTRLEPGLKAVAKGHDSTLEASAVQRLVEAYTAHARFEEQEFLPLSQTILGRDGNHMAALGMSLHMRHTLPQVMRSFGHRI